MPTSFADASDSRAPKRAPRMVNSAPRAIAESMRADGALLAALTLPSALPAQVRVTPKEAKGGEKQGEGTNPNRDGQ